MEKKFDLSLDELRIKLCGFPVSKDHIMSSINSLIKNGENNNKIKMVKQLLFLDAYKYWNELICKSEETRSFVVVSFFQKEVQNADVLYKINKILEDNGFLSYSLIQNEISKMGKDFKTQQLLRNINLYSGYSMEYIDGLYQYNHKSPIERIKTISYLTPSDHEILNGVCNLHSADQEKLTSLSNNCPSLFLEESKFDIIPSNSEHKMIEMLRVLKYNNKSIFDETFKNILKYGYEFFKNCNSNKKLYICQIIENDNFDNIVNEFMIDDLFAQLLVMCYLEFHIHNGQLLNEKVVQKRYTKVEKYLNKKQ